MLRLVSRRVGSYTVLNTETKELYDYPKDYLFKHRKTIFGVDANGSCHIPLDSNPTLNKARVMYDAYLNVIDGTLYDFQRKPSADHIPVKLSNFCDRVVMDLRRFSGEIIFDDKVQVANYWEGCSACNCHFDMVEFTNFSVIYNCMQRGIDITTTKNMRSAYLIYKSIMRGEISGEQLTPVKDEYISDMLFNRMKYAEQIEIENTDMIICKPLVQYLNLYVRSNNPMVLIPSSDILLNSLAGLTVGGSTAAFMIKQFVIYALYGGSSPKVVGLAKDLMRRMVLRCNCYG